MPGLMTVEVVPQGFGDALRAAPVAVRSVLVSRRRHAYGHVLTAIVAAAQVLLEPYVQDDEQIPAPHFLQPELGLAVTPVGPADRDHGVAVAARDGLERQLHGQVEVV